jgi:hypothetical protein
MITLILSTGLALPTRRSNSPETFPIFWLERGLFLPLLSPIIIPAFINPVHVNIRRPDINQLNLNLCIVLDSFQVITQQANFQFM